jgi:hypothetical protein
MPGTDGVIRTESSNSILHVRQSEPLIATADLAGGCVTNRVVLHPRVARVIGFGCGLGVLLQQDEPKLTLYLDGLSPRRLLSADWLAPTTCIPNLDILV